METKNQTTINISSLTIIKIIGIFLFLGFLYLIRDVLIIVFISGILAAILNPIVNFLQRKKIPRIIAILLIFFIILGILALIVTTIVPIFVDQINQIIKNFPQWKEKISEQFLKIETFGFLNMRDSLQNWSEQNLTQVGENIFLKIINIFGSLISFISVLIIVFYLLLEVEAIKKIIQSVIPTKFQSYTIQLFTQMQNKLSLWLRGQLILCLVIGTLSFIGLLILGVKSALLLALIAGIFEIIPYLGPILGAIPAVLLAFTQSPLTALLVIILYVLIQQLENNLLVPKIMSKTVGLNPVIIIIVFLIGGKLYGLIGALLAIPVATALSVLIKDYFELKRKEEKKLEQ
ncbi:AI-2E family transporter [Candidatus Kuenenbacteria bacterium]|nr:AI-2E family transporter [Candidatus Kuenenbacteria bacterium]